MSAQSSPDLPASLQRTTRTTGGEDVYAECDRAWLAAHLADDSGECRAYSPALIAAVDRAVELTEQRLDRSEDHLVVQLTAALMEARTDLAAMTARAHTAEAMYDRLRPLADACRRYLDRPDSDTIRRAVRAYDETGPETGLSATLPGFQATVVGSDVNGSEDGSGGAA